MSAAWSKVKLGEVLGLSDTSFPSSELGEVNLAGVYSFGRGLFARGPMLPSNTSYRSYNRLVVDDFVISQPKAWEGALARVTHDFDGWYLSPVFSTFRADSARLEPAFLDWFCKRKAVWTELQRNSRGIGARRETVSPETFLTLQIPLPPLAEQRRIVARIEELAAKIEEASALRRHAAEEAEALLHSLIGILAYETGWEMKLMPDVAEVNPPRVGSIKRLAQDDKVSFVPMKAVDEISGTIAWPEVRPLHEVAKGYTCFTNDDVIFARITPCMQNGKAALAKGLVNAVAFGSTEFHVLRPKTGVCGEWIYYLVRHKAFRDEAAEHFKGTAGQQRVPQSFFENKLIPVPPLNGQRRIVAELDALQAEVDTLKRLQGETATELNALLPSILDKAFKGEL
jgi:type I restriction enzyme S subunit